MPKFQVDFYMGDYIDSALVRIDEPVFAAVDDEWRSHFYDLYSREEIAKHIAYNLVVYRIGLSQMDGWANLPDEMAKVTTWPTLDDFDLQCKELDDNDDFSSW